jgi:hypothetical protein
MPVTVVLISDPAENCGAFPEEGLDKADELTRPFAVRV